MTSKTNNKIHIMQVLHSLEIGGAEKLAYDICENLGESFMTSFFCLDSLGFLSELIKKKGGAVYCFDRKEGLDFDLIKKFARILDEQKIDILHAHQYTPYFYSVLASVRAKRKVKVIFTEHGRHQPDKVRWKRVIFNKIFQPFTHKYTGVAKFSKDSMVKFEKIPARRIDVIYNGIDLKRFAKKYDKPSIRKQLGFLPEDKLAGIIARLDPIKDHKSLIKSISLLKNKHVKLLIVGDGPIRSELERQVEDLNLKNRVIFLGMRTDVPDLLMALDIFILPSIMEATSVTLLEAMSASLPVVATRVGGNREIVIENETGVLVPAQTPEKLADAIDLIIADKKLARSMGTAGRKRVEDFFTFDKMMRQYKKIYTELMK